MTRRGSYDRRRSTKRSTAWVCPEIKGPYFVMTTHRLPKCALCEEHTSDPRMGLLDFERRYYALCDGCAPEMTAESVLGVIEELHAKNAEPCAPLSSFGFDVRAFSAEVIHYVKHRKEKG